MTEERKKQLSEMSDNWLRALVEERTKEIEELEWEFRRRYPGLKSRESKLVELPCTLQELETAVHAYGDHKGFHGKVEVVLDSLIDTMAKDYLMVTEGGAE